MDRFRYPDAKQLELDQANGGLCLLNLGWLRYRDSRGVLGAVKNVTVSRSGGMGFASVRTERGVERPTHAGGMVGIDVGIARFAVLSDGTHFESLHGFKRLGVGLWKAQRSLGRMGRFSLNWGGAKANVQCLPFRIGSVRRDSRQWASAWVSENLAIVCGEDLHVRRVSRFAAGTIDQPG